MQPISSLAQAIYISKQWKINGINLSSVSIEEDTDLKANYIIWLNDTDVKENKNCDCSTCDCDLPLITVIRDQQHVYIQVMLLLS